MEYPIPAGSTSLGNGLFGITAGPDGNVYFTDTLDNAIGQITPAGVITELPLPPYSGGSFFKNGLDGITLGDDGKLAFTESTQAAIGKITTSGSYTQYPIGSSGALTGQGPDQVTTASDGTLWWTEDGSNAIGELTPAGVFTQYAVPNAFSGGIIGPSMKGITVGSDGNIWFTNWDALGDFIGEMTPTGNITEYPLSFGTDPVGITTGPDGNLWFTAYGSNTIDVMSTSGTMLDEYPVSAAPGDGGLGDLAGITIGSDNNLYFTAQTGYIGEITPRGVVTETPVSTTIQTIPGSSGPQPLAITSGPDGNIWFTDPWTDSVGVLRIPTGALPTATSVSASTTSATLGQPVTFTATVSDLSPGGLTPAGGDVTFSDESGVLDTEPLANGTATFTTTSLTAGMHAVSASFGGAPGFDPSSTTASVSVTISQGAPVITWASPADLGYGTALGTAQLHATASVPGTFTYMPPTGTVLGAGDSQTLTAIFTPTDSTDYTNVTKTVTINIDQATPIVTINRVNLTYGTPLANSQLIGTATLTIGETVDIVPGSWSYTGVLGRVLSAGAGQTEPVKFTPSDSSDYSTVASSVTLNVNPAPLLITADSETKPYGSASTFAGTEFTTSGLVNGDTVTSVTLNSAGAAATADVSGSPYPITPGAAVGTGLSNYTITYENGTLTVNQATPVIAVARAASSINPPAYGQSLTFEATVGFGVGSSVTPTGTVTFYNGNPTAGGSKIGSPLVVSGGRASITTKALAVSAAPHAIYAVYTPAPALSANVSSVTSLPLRQTVNSDQTEITVNSSADPSKKGKAVTITAVVLNKSVPGGGVPMGTVVFEVDGHAQGRPIALPASGKVVLSRVKLAVGTHTVTVLYTPTSHDFAASHGILVGGQKVKR